MKPDAGGWWRGLLLVALLLAIWELLFLWTGESALASPLATFRYAGRMLTDENFRPHLRDTLEAFTIAFALSVVLGLLGGFWLGFDRLSGDVLEPMVIAIYSIPKVTLYPILLLAFGLGLSAKVAFGVLHGVIPILLFTLKTKNNTQPNQNKTKHKQQHTPTQKVRSILFPAALPEIFTGLRIGFALTLIGSLLAEMFASQRGLGYLLMTGIGLHNVEQIMAVTLLVVVFAATVSVILLMVDRRLHRGG